MSAQAIPQPQSGTGLRWHQSLQFRLGILFLILLVVLGGVAYYATTRLISQGLSAGNYRFEDNVNRRLAAQIGDIPQAAETLANAIAVLAQARPSRAVLRTQMQQLVERSPQAVLFAAIGVWPEPGVYESGVERASVYLVRGTGGQLQAREDYNDPRTIPYYREAWYTPARFAPVRRCFWTLSYREPLSKRPIVTCTLPLDASGSFVGAVTLSIGLDALQKEFVGDTANDSGYAILLDRDNRLLALSALAAAPLGDAIGEGRSIAELAKNQPNFGPLAIALHERERRFLDTAVHSPSYDVKKVSALKDGTRDLSREEAESAMAAIWHGPEARADQPSEPLGMPEDPLLKVDGYASLRSLEDTHWYLASVTPAREGQDGARYLVLQALVLTFGAATITLALAWGAMRRTVVRPLRRMTRALNARGTAVDAESVADVTLDEGGGTEIGELAHWHNERARQLKSALATAQSARNRLTVETGERQRAQDTLARLQDRAAVALGAIADGVIVTDEHGVVEDINAAAQEILGLGQTDARGKPFEEVFVARLGGAHGAPLPSLPEIVIGRGTRLEYRDDLMLDAAGGERSIRLVAAPVKNRSGLNAGAVVTFRDAAREVPETTASAGAGINAEPLDIITGLGGRVACERRVRAVLGDSAADAHHAVAVMDLDHMSGINESSGHSAGDRVIESVSVLLAERVGGVENVFRLSGDRFAIVLPGHGEQDALAMAENLREHLQVGRFSWQDQEFSITGSFGVCLIAGSGQSPAEMLRRAGEAAAAAKRRGRNAVVLYTPEVEAPIKGEDDAIWVQRIRQGLDNHRLHLTTQRIIPNRNLASEGQVFEILLSLEDEEGFWAPPSRFLPVADRRGLSSEVDRWVVTHTLDLLEAQTEAYERMAFCSINLSAASVMEAQFLDFITEEFSRRGELKVRKLCFEIGEETISAHPQRAQRFCEAMRSIGCRVAIDQYIGRRAADIAVLRRLPVDFIKLDARQYRNLSSDAVEQMLAESALRVAHHLRRRVIVTGLEDEALVSAWRKAGADYCQGYIVAKPSPMVFSATGD